mmetsp:Transcript_50609/g.161932  ORF Transcript_50609/g.161932 Transcript_50609/m.161932 type:complete len:292 (+) Transcript_50609:361-1236(+)
MHAWALTCRPCTSPGSGTQEHATAPLSQAHCGKGSRASKMPTLRAKERTAAAVAVRSSIGRPTRAKSRMRSGLERSLDLPSTTTLHGDAVGSTNESEQATVAGSISSMGLTTADSAAEARIGSTMLAVAMLLKSCARRDTRKTTAKVVEIQLMWGSRLPMARPRTTSRPVSMKPRAMAKPQPMSSSTPKSSFSWTVLHVRSAWPRRLCEGRKKSERPQRQAMPALFSSGTPAALVTKGLMAKGLMMRRTICARETRPTATSSRDSGPASASSRSCASTRTSWLSGILPLCA